MADMVGLTYVNEARRQLALARDVPEVKQIIDRAELLRQYIRKQKGSLESQNMAAEVKLEAERRAGEMLADRDMNKGGRPPVTGTVGGTGLVPTLDDIGISKKQSARWQIEASVPEEAFEEHVAAIKAEGGELTSAALVQLGSRLQRQQAVEELSRVEVTLPNGPTKYRAIVIDPPWPVEKIEREERPMQGQALDYPTMTIPEIAALDVQQQADPDGCHLYLWVTHKFLPDGLRLVDGWGFRYQCLMTWVKPTGMTPFTWMYNTEHVIFAHRGGLRLQRMGLKLSFEAPVTHHSEKPEVFYERVRHASPERRLEMFARKPREGFDVWGNEVTTVD